MILDCYSLFIQLTGLPQTGASLATTSKTKEPVAADADADLQARWDMNILLISKLQVY